MQPYVDEVFAEWMEIALDGSEIEDRAVVLVALQLLMFGAFVTMAHARLSLAEASEVFDVAVRRLVVERRPSGVARGKGV